MTDHPITPPPVLFEIDHHPAVPPADLLKRWEDQWFDEEEHADVLLIKAFQAGADQELEACCSLLELSDNNAREFLYSARRPKPLSLKEQALGALGRFNSNAHTNWDEMTSDFDLLRRAVEQLDG